MHCSGFLSSLMHNMCARGLLSVKRCRGRACMFAWGCGPVSSNTRADLAVVSAHLFFTAPLHSTLICLSAGQHCCCSG